MADAMTPERGVANPQIETPNRLRPVKAEEGGDLEDIQKELEEMKTKIGDLERKAQEQADRANRVSVFCLNPSVLCTCNTTGNQQPLT